MTWWHYLLLVNFYLVLFFGFYALLLRRETFFQLNRVYLVAASLLSFVIPVIEADWVKNLFITQEVQHTIYNMPVGIPVIFVPVVETGITLGEVLNIVYISVTLFLLARLGWQLLVLKKAIEKPTPSAAYTFFKKISLGENVAQSKVIHDHEKVHANQWHSIDVMIIETVMIINWFNPVVYLYRFAIKYIHEFIADNHVIQAGTNKADYAMLLLTQSFDVSSNNLVNQFYNHSLLKKRIQMLQKNKSQRIALAKYGLSAPLFILMMIFSSATVNNSKAVAAITQKTENALAKPATEVIDAITDNAQIPTDNLTEETQAIVELPFGLYDVQPVELPDNMAPVDNSPILSQVAMQPTFPGGLKSFGEFLGNTIIYPAADRENGVSGKVIVSFVVEKDGSLSNMVALRGPSETLKNEALRVLKLSPKWQPGIQNDEPVRVSYTVPIAFTLEYEDDQPQFPGGLESFGKYLGNNIKYPAVDRKAGIQGKVILSYVIEVDGTLSDIKAVRAPSQSLADEAIRVMRKSPKWRPGTKDGKPARIGYVTPISFSLEGVEHKGPTANFGAVATPSSNSEYLQTNEVVIRAYVTPAEASNINNEDNTIYNMVDKHPEFPGGLGAFGKFLADHVRYPKADRDAGTTGKVIVSFVVERDGSLNNITPLRGPSEAMKTEAVLALTKSPKWQPGYKDGKAVRVSYTVPVDFSLTDDPRPKGSVIPPNDKKQEIEVTGSPSTPLVAIRGYKGDPPPLYVVDGVALDTKTNVESVVKTGDIVSMHILKDGATAKYGDKGKNGVIFVITKNAPKEVVESTTKIVSASALSNVSVTKKVSGVSAKPVTKIRVNGKTVIPTQPLYVVDGKIVTAPKSKPGESFLSTIPQEDIERMEVLKDESATKKYGDRGKNGVIEITTKKDKKK